LPAASTRSFTRTGRLNFVGNGQSTTGADGLARRTRLNGAAMVGGATLAGVLMPGTAQAAHRRTTAKSYGSRLLSTGQKSPRSGELSRLGSEIEPNEYLNSGKPINLKRVKPPIAVLSRGQTQSDVLWTWHVQVLSGEPAVRKSGSLVGYNQAGEPVARYSLVNGWPTKVKLASPGNDSRHRAQLATGR
jgi:hypothetical protein